MTSLTNIALVVHAGAGNIQRHHLSPESAAEHGALLEAALRAGFATLRADATENAALNAVETAVRFLEDDPAFNAGRGAVLTAAGHAELDAAIMDGRTGRAGAVAGVTTVRNPVTLARAVMEQTSFVLLSGAGADALARDLGQEQVDPSYFVTPHRASQLEEVQRREREKGTTLRSEEVMALSEDGKFGTVGAVACDGRGNLAAATSTGGMTNKRYGRIGDSPIIGAGTWAENATCAVSATGHGEYFIRLGVTHDIAARMRYGGQSVAEAANAVIHDSLPAIGGSGGVIALDAAGNAALSFNTPGMYRGYITWDGEVSVAIFTAE